MEGKDAERDQTKIWRVERERTMNKAKQRERERGRGRSQDGWREEEGSGGRR